MDRDLPIAPIEQLAMREEINEVIAGTRDKLTLSDELKSNMRQLLALLRSEEMRNLVEAGKITFAMVKPNVHLAKAENNNRTDHELAEEVIASIGDDFKIIGRQDFQIPVAAAADFYAHLEKLGKGIMEKVAGFMSSGATTALILYRDKGNAHDAWRMQIGATNPAEAEKGTIRQRFADTQENNAVHGSDSIKSVQQELLWFANLLEGMLKA
ncbi:MAG: hypothetical protein DSY80_09930 [Desulfocapsa sp.]|nr:MAG: hypothetical protein DSY80_09930 [Desulfocapsa sp.]